jgi:hypothetical protein
MAEAFISFCEALWRGWLANTLNVPQFIHDAPFDLDAAPEPYVSFNAGPNPLVALLTNPGYTMDHQRRAAVQVGGGPLSTTVDYSAAARALGPFYERELKGTAAGRRIAALRVLSSWVGYEGVLQVEACPFHSRSLPSKKKIALLKTINEGGLLGCYTEHVRAFLRCRPVVVVSAVSSRRSLGPEVVETLSPWLAWEAVLAGLVLERAKFVPLVAKDSKTTAAALVSFAGGVPKALVLMMGGNHLPAEKGLCVLAAALRPSSTQLG